MLCLASVSSVLSSLNYMFRRQFPLVSNSTAQKTLKILTNQHYCLLLMFVIFYFVIFITTMFYKVLFVFQKSLWALESFTHKEKLKNHTLAVFWLILSDQRKHLTSWCIQTNILHIRKNEWKWIGIFSEMVQGNKHKVSLDFKTQQKIFHPLTERLHRDVSSILSTPCNPQFPLSHSPPLLAI